MGFSLLLCIKVFYLQWVQIQTIDDYIPSPFYLLFLFVYWFYEIICIYISNRTQPAILQTPQLKLAAIYSRSLASAQALASGLGEKDKDEERTVDLYSNDSGNGRSFDDLCRRDDIKGMIIAYACPSAALLPLNSSFHTSNAEGSARHMLSLSLSLCLLFVSTALKGERERREENKFIRCLMETKKKAAD